MYFLLYLDINRNNHSDIICIVLHLSISNNTCNVTMVISVVYLHIGIANDTCNVTVVISVVYLHLNTEITTVT
jgi:hypothetical protein